jgi:hypothetical protein
MVGYVWTNKRGRFAAATVDRVSLGAFRSLKEASQAVFSATGTANVGKLVVLHCQGLATPETSA